MFLCVYPQAALKMREQQKDAEEERREEEEEMRREEEERLLMGPSVHQCCKQGDLERVKTLVQHNQEFIK